MVHLITAQASIERRKRCFCIPGSIFRTFKGTNQLIQDGAKFIQCVSTLSELPKNTTQTYEINICEKLSNESFSINVDMTQI